MSGAVKNTMYANSFTTDYIENKTFFYDENYITVISQLWMPWNYSGKRVYFKFLDSFFYTLDEFNGSVWIIFGDPIKYRNEVFVNRWEISNGILT